jgi:hypothetical protein
LIALVGFAFLFRLYVLQVNSGVVPDANLYYYFAKELSLNHELLPVEWPNHHMGFPIFLSYLFRVFPDNQFLIQKLVSILFSLASVPLVYSLAKSFKLDSKWAMVASALFAFEPRSLIISTYGLTDPMFIFLLLGSIVLARKNHTVFACAICILAAIVRIEAVFGFIIIFYQHFVNHKLSDRSLIEFGVSCLVISLPIIFILGSYPVVSERIFAKFTYEYGYIESYAVKNGLESFYKFINSFVYFGWSTFPMFIWFIPFGLYVYRNKTLCFYGLILLLPGLWAYFDAYDLRYFMPVIPVLSIVSAYGLRFLFHGKRNIISVEY